MRLFGCIVTTATKKVVSLFGLPQCALITTLVHSSLSDDFWLYVK